MPSPRSLHFKLQQTIFPSVLFHELECVQRIVGDFRTQTEEKRRHYISEDLSRGEINHSALPASLITNHLIKTDFISVRHLQKFLLRINRDLDVYDLLFHLKLP